ncbi:MAG: hypothetical protein P4M08_09575 [Oligoflexia bacterium]|nr:hypothetical protein [Oligoflexia bacterium]
MSKVVFLGGVLVSLLLPSSCATSFTGDAHIGRKDCVEKCEKWGMQLTGMVAMGEYSNACVCKVSGGATSLLDSDDGRLLSSAATVTAGTVGVELQRRLIMES